MFKRFRTKLLQIVNFLSLLILLRTAKFYSKFTFLNLIAGLCIFLLPLALIEFTILEAELLAVGFFFWNKAEYFLEHSTLQKRLLLP